jgi:hypothetical protein
LRRSKANKATRLSLPPKSSFERQPLAIDPHWYKACLLVPIDFSFSCNQRRSGHPNLPFMRIDFGLCCALANWPHHSMQGRLSVPTGQTRRITSGLPVTRAQFHDGWVEQGSCCEVTSTNSRQLSQVVGTNLQVCPGLYRRNVARNHVGSIPKVFPLQRCFRPLHPFNSVRSSSQDRRLCFPRWSNARC